MSDFNYLDEVKVCNYDEKSAYLKYDGLIGVIKSFGLDDLYLVDVKVNECIHSIWLSYNEMIKLNYYDFKLGQRVIVTNGNSTFEKLTGIIKSVDKSSRPNLYYIVFDNYHNKDFYIFEETEISNYNIDISSLFSQQIIDSLSA